MNDNNKINELDREALRLINIALEILRKPMAVAPTPEPNNVISMEKRA